MDSFHELKLNPAYIYLILATCLIISFIFDTKIVYFFYVLRNLSIILLPLMTFLSSPILIGLIIFYILFLDLKSKNYVSAFALAFSFSLAALSSLLIKNLTLRQRPYSKFNFNTTEPRNSYSFPSNHTASVYSTLKFFPKNSLKWIFYILLILIPISRLYLEVHYLSDLFMGVIVGLLASDIIVYLEKNHKLISKLVALLKLDRV